MAHWSEEWALQLVHKEKFGVAWEHLSSEVSDSVDRMQRVFKGAGSAYGIAMTTGAQSLEVRDARNRKLSFTLDKSEHVIRIAPSWRSGTEFRFRISDASGKITQDGSLFPGMKPHPVLTIESYVEASLKELTGGHGPA